MDLQTGDTKHRALRAFDEASESLQSNIVAS
jgi:hypothetical protein